MEIKMTIHAALGLMFNNEGTRVALIRKNRPKLCENKWCAIGGIVEDADRQPISAMIREFKEETGADTELSDWSEFCRIDLYENDKVPYKPYQSLHFFCAFSTSVLYACATQTDEIVDIVFSEYVSGFKDVMYNLKWLIPLALDKSAISRPLVVFQGINKEDYAK